SVQVSGSGLGRTSPPYANSATGRGPFKGHTMIFTGWPPRSMPHRSSAFLAGQLIAREPVHGETLDQRVILPGGNGVAHGLAAHRRRLETPRTPPGIEEETLHRRDAHDGCKVGSHVGETRPLAIDLHLAQEREQIEHVRTQP